MARAEVENFFFLFGGGEEQGGKGKCMAEGGGEEGEGEGADKKEP